MGFRSEGQSACGLEEIWESLIWDRRSGSLESQQVAHLCEEDNVLTTIGTKTGNSGNTITKRNLVLVPV